MSHHDNPVGLGEGVHGVITEVIDDVKDATGLRHDHDQGKERGAAKKSLVALALGALLVEREHNKKQKKKKHKRDEEYEQEEEEMGQPEPEEDDRPSGKRPNLTEMFNPFHPMHRVQSRKSQTGQTRGAQTPVDGEDGYSDHGGGGEDDYYDDAPAQSNGGIKSKFTNLFSASRKSVNRTRGEDNNEEGGEDHVEEYADDHEAQPTLKSMFNPFHEMHKPSRTTAEQKKHEKHLVEGAVGALTLGAVAVELEHKHKKHEKKKKKKKEDKKQQQQQEEEEEHEQNFDPQQDEQGDPQEDGEEGELSDQPEMDDTPNGKKTKKSKLNPFSGLMNKNKKKKKLPQRGDSLQGSGDEGAARGFMAENDDEEDIYHGMNIDRGDKARGVSPIPMRHRDLEEDDPMYDPHPSGNSRAMRNQPGAYRSSPSPVRRAPESRGMQDDDDWDQNDGGHDDDNNEGNRGDGQARDFDAGFAQNTHPSAPGNRNMNKSGDPSHGGPRAVRAAPTVMRDMGDRHQAKLIKLLDQDILQLCKTFHYSKCNGRKKAVCIGIDYIGSNNALEGCVNDARFVRKFLMHRYHYNDKNIVLLVDDSKDPRMKPTRKNIIGAMRWLVKGAGEHDSLFFHYSGHGGQTKDTNGDEWDGKDEVIFPVDYKTEGHIVDDEMNAIMVQPLPVGCRLTAVYDSCHSGTVLDLPFAYHSNGKLKQHRITPEAKKNIARASDVICFSGSTDSGVSGETSLAQSGEAVGAMSYAFIHALRENPNLTYAELLRAVRRILNSKYHQKPQLTSSHPIDTSLKFVL